ncbi:MAG TPA: phosphomannomutase/phosphoglucomutase [Planctomycetes bacterium]|nr:phosphomannomutase/phosphoglucomutase [Planctomycetota bacterium]
MSVFKAYDVRGIYGEQIDEDLARKIGAAFVDLLGGGPIVVGRDMRACAPSIAKAFIEGARRRGADVIDIGLVSTPQTYFAIGHFEVNGGVQITASHNPSEYIGMKFCRRDCVPISYETGIRHLEEAAAKDLPQPADREGCLSARVITDDYVEHVSRWLDAPTDLALVIDAGNGMAGHELPPVLDKLGISAERLYFDLDGSFPNHEANPIKAENMQDLIGRVRETGADLGVAFDGDADRCAFVDETGAIISSDLMTAIMARELLGREPGAHVVYDLRSSRVVAEEIEQAGGKPVLERVGHSFIKATMRKTNAIFGGELSGHYYFRENYTSDSGVIAMLLTLEILRKTGKKLSELVNPLRRYPATGEINFVVEDKDGMIRRLEDEFSDGKIDHVDGITVRYPTWWFNVRKSNTEPLLRLNLEADDGATLDSAKSRLLALLGEPEE